MKKLTSMALLAVTTVLLSSCATPRTFVQTIEPSWASIEIRDGVEYDVAWEAVVDTLVKRFDLAVLEKEHGYIRTAWLYSWTGEMNPRYRVSVIVKFSPDKSKVEIRSIAERRRSEGGSWIQGSDTRLLETVKADIMGTIGRTTR
jgi:hypothetical protein